MNRLPKTWATSQLGTVLPIQYGKGLTKANRDSDGIVPVVGSSGVVGHHSQPCTSGPTLVIGRKGNVGSIHYLNSPCWPIDTVYFTQGSENTNLRFFAYQLDYLDLRHLDKSTAIPGLNRDDYNVQEVVLAPLPEQHRIVEAIESYFTRLDDAVANLERVQRNLKRYRASVLKAAVEGRLVPTEAELACAEDRDYEPASALLARILAERRRRWEEAELAKMEAKGKPPKNDKWKAKYKEPVDPCTTELRDLPPGWVWATIDQLLLSLDQGWSPRCERRPVGPDEEWGVIKTSAIQHMAYEESGNKALPSDKEPRPHLEVRPGDILITRAGPRVRVGVCCLVRHTNRRLMLCDKVYRLRVDDTYVSPSYVELILNSPRIMDEVEKIKSGISDSGLNLTQGKFCALAVPLPPRADQDRIVASVARGFSVSEAVQKDGVSSRVRLSRLRQAILKLAFEGKLVDQDPNDEPATALLKRITVVRESTDTSTKTKKRGRRKARSTKA